MKKKRFKIKFGSKTGLFHCAGYEIHFSEIVFIAVIIGILFNVEMFL